ncbi:MULTISPECIES: type II secretion system protein N [unclassified Pseudomonas]|uniref:type II secretion system protein N n=1 Tax=unclassified Pseudomonas TaxID=196821 RepID=UPI001B326B83|nr:MULTISPECIES: type II secretion system protein N [unclassified Pseudomonas]MBP5943124.1 general secretion pathway protein GspC [Pseudomonas sp. P9(2020)]MBZ9562040.1 general secretion pathway protein GspC [Pseudomonas sp. P116]
MTFTARFSPPQMIQVLALLAVLVGVATWSSLLLTSAESHTPAAAPQLLAARSDSPALQWFSNQTAPVDIKVSGVMAGSRGAVAILSLNGGPPRSFLQGERVGPGVKLVAVQRDGVVIEQGGERVRLGVERLAEGVVLPRLTRP